WETPENSVNIDIRFGRRCVEREDSASPRRRLFSQIPFMCFRRRIELLQNTPCVNKLRLSQNLRGRFRLRLRGTFNQIHAANRADEVSEACSMSVRTHEYRRCNSFRPGLRRIDSNWNLSQIPTTRLSVKRSLAVDLR